MKKLLYIFILLLSLTACKTKYVSVPEYHKVYVARIDSFMRTDTIREKEWMTIKEVDSTELVKLGIRLKNMTSAYLIEKNKNIERYSSESAKKTDTIIKTDTIPVEVEKELSSKQKAYIVIGEYTVKVVGIAIILIVVFLILKRTKIIGLIKTFMH